MPPLPPSSAGGGAVVVGSVGVVLVVSVGGVVSVVSVVVGSVVVGSVVVSVEKLVDSEETAELESPPPSPAMTMTATTRPTITAISPATTSLMFPCGWSCGSSGWPIIRVGSSCMALFLRSEYRVEDLAGVLDLKSVAQAHLDLRPA